jgi:hypothetical protein
VREFFLCFHPLSRIRFFACELTERFEIGDSAFELAQRIQERAQPRNFFDVDLGALAV